MYKYTYMRCSKIYIKFDSVNSNYNVRVSYEMLLIDCNAIRNQESSKYKFK